MFDEFLQPWGEKGNTGGNQNNNGNWPGNMPGNTLPGYANKPGNGNTLPD